VGAALAASDPHVRPDPAAPASSGPFAVAFSGGLDSTVLLHAAVRRAGASRVLALHVHHGLQPAADGWVEHCAAQAARLGVAFRVLRAEGRPARGDSVEQWARGERYRLLLAAARDARATALLTAHHADDQLETLLLALARGCGLDGLTGIAARDRRDGMLLLRPLLELDRAALEADARARGLEWVEDPSNADPAHARNAVRARVLPMLHATLPDLVAQLPGTLSLLAQARATLDALAASDLRAARPGDDRDPRDDAGAFAGPDAVSRRLDRRVLAALPCDRRARALRAWLVGLGARPPVRAALAEMDAQLITGQGAHGDVAHDGWRLLRHRDRLDAVHARAMPSAIVPTWVRWAGEPALPAPCGGTLRFERDPSGVSVAWLSGRCIEVAAGVSSERLRLRAGGPSRTLKNLWQEHGVPPWVRASLPALRVDGRLLAAAPFGTDRGAGWPRDGDRVSVTWSVDDREDPRAAFAPPRTDPPRAL
jgi:tRNA(Ile)-lysidine synthase